MQGRKKRRWNIKVGFYLEDDSHKGEKCYREFPGTRVKRCSEKGGEEVINSFREKYRQLKIE